MLRPLYPYGRDLIPIVQKAGWAPGLIWMGAEKLSTTGIQSQNCPARKKPLCQLRHHINKGGSFIFSVAESSAQITCKKI